MKVIQRMAFRGHRCRSIFSTCIASTNKNVPKQNAIRPKAMMFHSQPAFNLLVNQINRPENHTWSILSSSYRIETRPASHKNPLSARYLTTFTKSEYVHPLSQIVLEHLQSNHSHWVQQTGLDTALKLNKDGTFILRFPGPDNDDGTADVVAEDGSSEGETVSKNGSIWTMYEPEEKMHFLCVSKGSLVGRYMLQDNKKPAWHSDVKSTHEKVQDAVDEMIEKIEEVERGVV